MGCKCAPACKKAIDDATKKWPRRNRASDGCCGDAAHAKRKSDHNPDASGYAHAFDITHDPANGVDCNALAEALTKSKDSRIKYIIWNRRIWFPTRGNKPQGWSKYSGANPHTKHMHVSIHTNSRNDLSPWPWSPEVGGQSVTAVAPAARPTLREGARGQDVMVLQDWLSVLGLMSANRIDLVFGKITRQAVIDFQLSVGLTADGICGSKTWAALGQAVKARGK